MIAERESAVADEVEWVKRSHDESVLQIFPNFRLSFVHNGLPLSHVGWTTFLSL